LIIYHYLLDIYGAITKDQLILLYQRIDSFASHVKELNFVLEDTLLHDSAQITLHPILMVPIVFQHLLQPQHVLQDIITLILMEPTTDRFITRLHI
jgi:hypothetical protein